MDSPGSIPGSPKIEMLKVKNSFCYFYLFLTKKQKRVIIVNGEGMKFEYFKDRVNYQIDNYLIPGMKEIKEKGNGSFCELTMPNFRFSLQSFNIRIGTLMEKVYNDFVSKFAINLKEKCDLKKIKSKQIDILFEKDNLIYYFESKTNVNLDTEKSKATYNKIKMIHKLLSEKFQSCKLQSFVLCSRFDRTEKYNKYVKTDYLPLSMIKGYADFFELFDTIVTTEEWEGFFKMIGSRVMNTFNFQEKNL